MHEFTGTVHILEVFPSVNTLGISDIPQRMETGNITEY